MFGYCNSSLDMTTLKQLALLLLCSSLFFSCSKKEEQSMRAGLGGKKLGGTYTLNEIRGNPASMDPVRIVSKLEDDIAGNIYDKLIDNNEKLELVPELATKWEISPDGNTYTFHLRTDARFHDDVSFTNGKGRVVNASDIKYSLERVCDKKTTTSGYWIFQDIVVGANDYFNRDSTGAKEVTGFKVLNDSTFVVQLIKPFAPFLEHLTTSFGYIIPKEAVEHYGKDFFQHPVGSGAFRFDHWSPDQEIVLKRNPNYWQHDAAGNQLPLLDAIRFTFMKDDKTLFQNFQRGAVDEDFTLPTESFASIISADKKLLPPYDTKYTLQHISAMNSFFIDLLCSGKVFKNMALRRALSFAVDRQQICRYVLKNGPHGPADHGIVPPAFERYPIQSVVGVQFNPDSARHWLEVAGFPGGKGAPKIVFAVYNEPRMMQVAEAVCEMWKANLGLQVETQVMQTSQLLDASDDGKLDMWLTRWYADYPEVENFLNLLDGRLVPDDPTQKSYPNNTRWRSKAFTDIFQTAIGTTDETKRMELYAKAENIAVAESPNIPLFYEEHYRLLQPYVRDNPLDPMNRIDLKTVWLDK
jgi:oligopeptide transport system substrate-binding protein